MKKLQIKPGSHVNVINPPEGFNAILGDLLEEVTIYYQSADPYHALLIFAITKAEMKKALDEEQGKIGPQTVCWIIYPKAKSKLASDLNLMQSWEELKDYHLTPCASAAIDATWTALRIKPIDTQKKSGIGNAEIQKNEYGNYVDVTHKIVTLPEDLKAVLETQPQALHFYQQLSYSNKKEYVLWVLTAKQEKTRIERIQKSVEKLNACKKNPTEK